MNDSAKMELEQKGKAFHEAGHAVLQHVFGMTLQKISIVPQSRLIGGVSVAEAEHPLVLQQRGAIYPGTREYDIHICHQIMINQAGEASQMEFCPASLEDYQLKLDRRSIQILIKQWNSHVPAAERQQKLDELFDYTAELLNDPFCAAAVQAVAEALIDKKEITGSHAIDIIRKAFSEIKTARRQSGQPSLKFACPHCVGTQYYEP